MTMPVGTLRNDYVGSGALSLYDYDFKIFDDADLQIIIADDLGVEFPALTLTTHFTVSGVGEDDGGSIQLVNGGFDWQDAGGDLLTDYTITILSARASDQDLELRNQGPYYPEDIEEAFDRAVILIKQLEEKVGRVIQLPATSPLNNVQIGPPTALYFLRWNAAGDAIEAVAAGGLATKVVGETPTGLLSGTAFVMANTPNAGTLAVYINGERTLDFSFIGTALTTGFAPGLGGSVIIDYEH